MFEDMHNDQVKNTKEASKGVACNGSFAMELDEESITSKDSWIMTTPNPPSL